MRMQHFLVIGIAAASACVMLLASANAQQPSARHQAAVPAPPAQKCLRALDGSCTNPDLVEAAAIRSIIMSSMRVSYFGTPAGTVGGGYIPFERFFRDNDTLFGLPTATCTACVGVRTK
jgi:hypothetical protein